MLRVRAGVHVCTRTPSPSTNKLTHTAAYAAPPQVAEKHGLTPTELALAFVKSRWFVASTIIGATTMEQLRENIGAFDVELSAECLADIAAVYRRYRDPAFN